MRAAALVFVAGMLSCESRPSASLRVVAAGDLFPVAERISVGFTEKRNDRVAVAWTGLVYGLERLCAGHADALLARKPLAIDSPCILDEVVLARDEWTVLARGAELRAWSRNRVLARLRADRSLFVGSAAEAHRVSRALELNGFSRRPHFDTDSVLDQSDFVLVPRSAARRRGLLAFEVASFSQERALESSIRIYRRAGDENPSLDAWLRWVQRHGDGLLAGLGYRPIDTNPDRTRFFSASDGL
ncbi:MAG: hypothetical protein AAFX94_05610 [Myxococcota bacterium]